MWSCAFECWWFSAAITFIENEDIVWNIGQDTLGGNVVHCLLHQLLYFAHLSGQKQHNEAAPEVVYGNLACLQEGENKWFSTTNHL